MVCLLLTFFSVPYDICSSVPKSIIFMENSTPLVSLIPKLEFPAMSGSVKVRNVEERLVGGVFLLFLLEVMADMTHDTRQ